MQKIIINTCYGGFGFSQELLRKFQELHPELVRVYEYDDESELDYQNVNPRIHPTLIRLVEEFGKSAGSDYSKLKIVEIPDDVEWFIQEYDGIEWVAEKHRTWS